MEYRMDTQQASGVDVLQWFSSGAQEVASHRKYLNLINVFPVPDGDTGTNLSTTLRAMVEKPARTFSFGNMLQGISQSGLENARGNSGIIFASYVSGLAQEGASYDRVSVGDFARIAAGAVRHLYNAVEQPMEGTLMSVIRDWAVFINRNSDQFKGFQELFTAAYSAARQSMENTRNQLAVLRKHNVVDSGAAGFVRFLEGINRVFDEGHTLRFTEDEKVETVVDTEEETPAFRYCTEALIQLDGRQPEQGEAVSDLVKQAIDAMGDSLIVSPRGDKIKVHIHTNEPANLMAKLEPFGTIVEQKADDMLFQSRLRTVAKSSVGLITDSIADLPDEFLLENSISVIPMGVLANGTVYLDKLTMDLPHLFTRMDEPGAYPTSSQPEPARIRALLTARLEQFDSLIVLSVADQLSGTYQAMVKAAQAVSAPEHPVTVLDTRLNSGAQGLLVHRAAELAAQGKTHQEIIADLKTRISRIKIYVCLNTLAYAVRGGRVPNTIGRVGMAVGLRPIMTLDSQGHGAAFGAAFSQKGLAKKIFRLVKRALRKGGIENYAIVHGDNLPLANEYREQMIRLTGKEPVFVSKISSVVALHAGPGTVAICFTQGEEA
ncbi:MAG: DegV family protein [Eubacteriales bacterium]|nr:DegV family protein [Eubacteriales bacterium]